MRPLLESLAGRHRENELASPSALCAARSLPCSRPSSASSSSYDCVGEEKLPDSGPAIVAANHPSYLDPVLLSLQVRRPIRFMAWDLCSAFPLSARWSRVRRLSGRHAAGAKGLRLRRGQGGWCATATWSASSRKASARDRVDGARIARRRGAACLGNGGAADPARSAGPSAPGPTSAAAGAGQIRVRYHDPIDPARYARCRSRAPPALLAELRRRVEQTLMPGVRSDLRIDALYPSRGAWPRWAKPCPPRRSRCSSSGRRERGARLAVPTPYIATCCSTSSFSPSAASPSGFGMAPPRHSRSPT